MIPAWITVNCSSSRFESGSGARFQRRIACAKRTICAAF
jgi:hypothetical protein